MQQINIEGSSEGWAWGSLAKDVYMKQPTELIESRIWNLDKGRDGGWERSQRGFGNERE